MQCQETFLSFHMKDHLIFSAPVFGGILFEMYAFSNSLRCRQNWFNINPVSCGGLYCMSTEYCQFNLVALSEDAPAVIKRTVQCFCLPAHSNVPWTGCGGMDPAMGTNATWAHEETKGTNECWSGLFSLICVLLFCDRFANVAWAAARVWMAFVSPYKERTNQKFVL